MLLNSFGWIVCLVPYSNILFSGERTIICNSFCWMRKADQDLLYKEKNSLDKNVDKDYGSIDD